MNQSGARISRIVFSLCAFLVLLIGCSRFSDLAPIPLGTPPTFTPGAKQSITPTPWFTPDPNVSCKNQIAAHSNATGPAASPTPGMLVRGCVYLPGGAGLGGVRILRAFAGYGGEVIATTDKTGYFESKFYYIPGDEMVRLWAELQGYVIDPEGKTAIPGVYYWRHYFGYLEMSFVFVARRAP